MVQSAALDIKNDLGGGWSALTEGLNSTAVNAVQLQDRLKIAETEIMLLKLVAANGGGNAPLRAPPGNLEPLPGPDQRVSSLSCNFSWVMPPKIMAPRRPLPMGSASTHCLAG